jgi:hypothetical protein
VVQIIDISGMKILQRIGELQVMQDLEILQIMFIRHFIPASKVIKVISYVCWPQWLAFSVTELSVHY